ncbi:Z1 domain protein [compost metagenome]
MLVNVTRFTDVQDRLATAIKNYLFELTEEIKQYIADDDLWQNHASLRQLHALFLEHYTSSSTSWQKARRRLYDSIASVKVLTINQKSEKSDRLNYSAYKNTEKGRRVIAVGGLTLSRGLTLEGLCVSYFYRNSKAYDTLLQMGRWFGYRPGYSDLCRIWMDPDVQGWFSHIASVIGELRADIRRMHVNKQPPRNFGIRVRSHPDVLMVTAANKMRNAQEVKIEVSFSGYGTETPFLPKSHELNSSNLNKVRDFTKELGQASLNKGRCLWSNVEPIQIVSFLRNLEISTMNMAFVPDMSGDERPLIKFIRDNSIPSLRHWDVCLAQGEGSLIDDLQILCADGTYMNVQARRRQFEKTTSEFTEYLKVNKHRVGEIGDEKVGMSGEEIQAAEHFWSEEVKNDPDKSGKTIPGWAYRHTRAKPLLTIHLIQPVNPENPNSKSAIRIMDADRIESKVLVAVSLSFPKFSENSATYVPYKLNKVALRNIGLLDEENYDNDQD